MARPRVLTERELTVALLARQLLLARRPRSAAAAVRRLVALQAQYSPSPYVALHARVEGFAIADLERALRRGAVVKSTLMRGTLHLVHAADYPAYASAWRWQARRLLAGREPELAARAAEITAALDAFLATPRTTDEVRALTRRLAGGRLRHERDALDWARSVLPLVHVPPSGFWRRHGRFSLVRWAGPPVPEDPHAGTVTLVRRYLAAFGPATREDLAAFTWLRYGQLDPALAALEPLRRLTDDRGRELLDLPRAPLPREDVPVPVRFLPKWDALLLSHRDRGRVLPEAHADAILAARNGEMPATYLVDGQVAGTWRAEAREGTAVLTVRPLAGGRAALPAALEPEGLRLLAFLHPEARRRELVLAS